MSYKLKKSIYAPILLGTLLFLGSCIPTSTSGLRSRDTSNITGNNTSTVGLTQGRILADNPIILSKNASLSDSYDLNKLLSVETITSNSFLKGGSYCYGQEFCFEVRENKDSPAALQTTNGKWAYSASSAEFLEVNTYYHLNKIMDNFFSNLMSGYSLAYNGLSANYKTALPQSFRVGLDRFNALERPLTAYADCNAPNNSYFERTLDVLCFGYLSDFPKVKWAQDSTVIYHEAGHFLQKLQLNIRNPMLGPKSEMGNIFYDEAAALGEGLSDFYSYFINGRSHFSEWAAGRFLGASRPMNEDDPLHISALASNPDQRLSYPQFLTYNPNKSSIPEEDIHTAGMIISHYLVALTTDLQEKCSMSNTEARNMVTYLLTETLAEHGDRSSAGVEGGAPNRINHSSQLSQEWIRIVNPLNYRNFMQTFAKNLLMVMGNSTLNKCAGGIYSRDQIESLIDQYGLLLFRTYNENRNFSAPTPLTKRPTPVNSNNRKKSTLISKDLLILDPTTNASSAYVIDNRSTILSAIAAFQAGGILSESLSEQTPSDLGFNNNNGKVSPGEVVALALNLYNNSNSTMGGIQILANDWHHLDPLTGKPCRFASSMSNDNWPTIAEGATPCTETKTIDASYKYFSPVCFMQYNDSTSTKWISQKEFKNKMALDSSMCLNKDSDQDCFVRAIKGADQAHYSKLNPHSNWAQTMADPETKKAPSLDWGNVILFEVSKHIPPGTTIDCRLRVRFTNCEDCYHKQSDDSSKSNYTSDTLMNGYDFTDEEFNGPRPYKIIHLTIPVVD